MILNNTVDIVIGVVVGAIALAIAIYLIVVYKNNPCGGCNQAKQCKAFKKMSKSLLKNYKKCYKKDDTESK
jgi:hypothetical protein